MKRSMNRPYLFTQKIRPILKLFLNQADTLRLVRASQQPSSVDGENNQQLGKMKKTAIAGFLAFLRFFIFFRILFALMSWHGICNAYRSSFAWTSAVHINPMSFIRRAL
jgi:hypothetical protein